MTFNGAITYFVESWLLLLLTSPQTPSILITHSHREISEMLNYLLAFILEIVQDRTRAFLAKLKKIPKAFFKQLNIMVLAQTNKGCIWTIFTTVLNNEI